MKTADILANHYQTMRTVDRLILHADKEQWTEGLEFRDDVTFDHLTEIGTRDKDVVLSFQVTLDLGVHNLELVVGFTEFEQTYNSRDWKFA